MEVTQECIISRVVLWPSKDHRQTREVSRSNCRDSTLCPLWPRIPQLFAGTLLRTIIQQREAVLVREISVHTSGRENSCRGHYGLLWCRAPLLAYTALAVGSEGQAMRFLVCLFQGWVESRTPPCASRYKRLAGSGSPPQQGGLGIWISFFPLTYWGGGETNLQSVYPLYWILMSWRSFAHETKPNMYSKSCLHQEMRRNRIRRWFKLGTVGVGWWHLGCFWVILSCGTVPGQSCILCSSSFWRREPCSGVLVLRAMLTPLPSPVLTQMEILKQGRGPSTESLMSTVAWPRHGGLQMNAKVEAPPPSKEGKAEVLGLSFRVSIQISKVNVLEMK